MLEVLAYGEVGVDNLIRVPYLPAPERAVFPSADHYHVGGAAANTAVMLAGWGVAVGLAGNAIGDDERGARLGAWLSAQPSLDLSHLEVRPGLSTPFCRILVLPDGERAILVFGYPQTPKTALTAGMLDGARFLALDLYGSEERLRAAQVARDAGAVVVVGDVIWPEHPVLPLAAIAANSAAYIRSEFPGLDPVAHATRLHQVSGGIVVTTDGPNPVHVVDSSGGQFWVQPPTVEVVDATGAGDAFKAGLIFGLLRGWDLPRAARWAAAAGALKVRALGAVTTVPSRDEVSALAESLAVSA